MDAQSLVWRINGYRIKQPAHSFGGIFSIISGRLACGFGEQLPGSVTGPPRSLRARSGARSFFSLVGAFSRTAVNRSSIAFHLPESLVARLVCALARFFCSDRSLERSYSSQGPSSPVAISFQSPSRIARL